MLLFWLSRAENLVERATLIAVLVYYTMSDDSNKRYEKIEFLGEGQVS